MKDKATIQCVNCSLYVTTLTAAYSIPTQLTTITINNQNNSNSANKKQKSTIKKCSDTIFGGL